MSNKLTRYNEPVFNEDTGYLLPGIHLITVEDLFNHKILAATPERIKLINSLKLACKTYWSYEINEIYANGSFATSKPIPNDIDGYLQVSYTDPGFLKLIRSNSIWGNFKGKNHSGDKMPMWHEHKIEFYIDDPDFSGKNFNPFNFFTHSREGIKRGIIKVIQSKGDIK